jgi:hypothetical protein
MVRAGDMAAVIQTARLLIGGPLLIQRVDRFVDCVRRKEMAAALVA